VILRGLPRWGGFRCSSEIQGICKAFGIKDLFAKVYHRRVKSYMYKAIFNAFESIVPPETQAKLRGKIYFNPQKVFRERAPYGL